MKQLNTAIIRVKNGDGEFRTLQAIRGATSYEVAVQNGFVGTETEWMSMMLDDGWVTKCQELENNKASKTELLELNARVYEKETVLSDSTRELLGLNIDTVPDDAFVALLNIHKGHIATGEYTGTGDYGSENPCILSFNGTPEFVVIQRKGGTGFHSSTNNMVVAIKGVEHVDTTENTDSRIHLTWGENSISWYNSDSSLDQNNYIDYIYRYFAVLSNVEYGTGSFNESV